MPAAGSYSNNTHTLFSCLREPIHHNTLPMRQQFITYENIVERRNEGRFSVDVKMEYWNVESTLEWIRTDVMVCLERRENSYTDFPGLEPDEYATVGPGASDSDEYWELPIVGKEGEAEEIQVVKIGQLHPETHLPDYEQQSLELCKKEFESIWAKRNAIVHALYPTSLSDQMKHKLLLLLSFRGSPDDDEKKLIMRKVIAITKQAITALQLTFTLILNHAVQRYGTGKDDTELAQKLLAPRSEFTSIKEGLDTIIQKHGIHRTTTYISEARFRDRKYE